MEGVVTGGLIELARRYVACADELESLREQIKLAVINGGGETTPKVPFASAQRRGRQASQPNHPNAQAAAQEESKIIELIKSQPGMRSVEIARRTGAKANTVAQRLQRMESKGLISRGDGRAGGWQAVSAVP
jgi:predicted transcriptional regulator